MRRALLTALLALPGLALGQTTPTTAGVINTDPDYINIASCGSGTAQVNAAWLINATSTFVTGGNYYVYASTKQWSTASGSDQNYCPETSDTGGTYFAGLVGGPFDASSASVAQQALQVSKIVSTTKLDCTSATDQFIYLCVHWVQPSSTNGGGRAGWAHTTLTFSTRRPGVPTIASVQPGDGRLHVSITAGTGDATTAKYEVVATAVDTTQDPSPHASGKQTGGVTIKGLKNNVTYSLVAYAYSDQDNPSTTGSAPVQGTPVPVNDFWDQYSGEGGTERGGCSTGAAGLGALVAAAALLLLRRRHA